MKNTQNDVVVQNKNCHAEEPLFSIFSTFKKQGGDPRQHSSGMTPLFKNTGQMATSGMTSLFKNTGQMATSGMTSLFNKGFTLIELLVVVLIIGILAKEERILLQYIC